MSRMTRLVAGLGLIAGLAVLATPRTASATEQGPKQGVPINADPETGEFTCRIFECCTGWPCSQTGTRCCYVG
jgi:hypothetical protein